MVAARNQFGFNGFVAADSEGVATRSGEVILREPPRPRRVAVTNGIKQSVVISQGRAHGMPAWGTLLPPQYIWQLVGYIQSMRTPQEPDPPR